MPSDTIVLGRMALRKPVVFIGYEQKILRGQKIEVAGSEQPSVRRTVGELSRSFKGLFVVAMILPVGKGLSVSMHDQGL